MQAVVRKDATGKDVELVTMEIQPVPTLEVPQPKANQVLVKVLASPINPSDLSYMKGTYGDASKQPKPPVVLGFEGSGTVVAVGEGVSKDLLGKAVCFFGNCHSPDFMGSWSNYTLKPADSVLFVSDKVDLEAAAMTQVNPKTVMGFWHLIESGKHKAVVQTAAGSACGKMLFKLCQKHHIEVINVVRSPDNVERLLKLGATYVLNSQSPDFSAQLAEAIAKVQPTIFFDAVGGSLTGSIFTAMPAKSELQVYGSLESADILGLKGTDIRYQDKVVKGYHVVRLFASLPPELRQNYVNVIWDDLQHGGTIFQTEVAARFRLSEWKEALQAYPQLASKGKVLIKPND